MNQYLVRSSGGSCPLHFLVQAADAAGAVAAAQAAVPAKLAGEVKNLQAILLGADLHFLYGKVDELPGQ